MNGTVISQLESKLALPDSEEERLAHQAPSLDQLTGPELERLARLAYRIAQVQNGQRALLLTTSLVPWNDLTDRERANARATVLRIFQAGCLTGWIDPT